MKRLLIAALITLLPALALGATYYKSPTGSAANKEAASGPCTTAANCMSFSVYAGETFSDGDVIVHCHTPQDGVGDNWIIFGSFADVSQTLVIPAAPTADTRFDIAGNTRTTIGGDTRVTK